MWEEENMRGRLGVVGGGRERERGKGKGKLRVLFFLDRSNV